ncbi:hypothetical protein E2493_00335 [Sphingomonas parva]|uniref:Uncharacterized protein n=1 Tax=Sphingomonas parva TaxID=2555898 RepID=A0A4Y8ZVZ4_9SPHN|nr:hypothetical protein [Sphingomonas parva]TFI60198.1 hypothetical protein E2493_00335 [Sphingomonas parva]
MSLKTLATLACLSLVGTAGGVWLGGAAVGEIDPFFFSVPESSFVSDRMAYRSPDWTEVQIGEYEQEGLNAGIGQGPMPGAVYASPAVATYGESWASAAEDAAADRTAPATAWRPREEPARAWTPPEEPVRVWRARGQLPEDREAEWQQVERYASYRIADEPVAAEEPDPEPEIYAAAQEIGAE